MLIVGVLHTLDPFPEVMGTKHYGLDSTLRFLDRIPLRGKRVGIEVPSFDSAARARAVLGEARLEQYIRTCTLSTQYWRAVKEYVHRRGGTPVPLDTGRSYTREIMARVELEQFLDAERVDQIYHMARMSQKKWRRKLEAANAHHARIQSRIDRENVLRTLGMNRRGMQEHVDVMLYGAAHAKHTQQLYGRKAQVRYAFPRRAFAQLELTNPFLQRILDSPLRLARARRVMGLEAVRHRMTRRRRKH